MIGRTATRWRAGALLTDCGMRAESALLEGDAARKVAGAMAVVAALTALAAGLREDFPVVLMTLVTAAGLLAVMRPFVVLTMAVLLSTTYGWVVVGADTSGFQILIVIALVGVALERRTALLGQIRSVLAVGPPVWLVLAVGWMVLAAVVRSGHGNFGYVRNYVGAMLLVLLVTILASDERRRLALMGATVCGAAASAAIGLAQVVTTDALVSAWVLPGVAEVRQTYDRLASPWGLGSVASGYSKDVLVGFLLAAPFVLRRGGRHLRVAGWTVLGVLALGLVVSGSRSAWLGAIFALTYLLVVGGVHLHRLPTAAMVLVLSACMVMPSLPNRVQTRLGLPGQLVGARAPSAFEHASITPPGAVLPVPLAQASRPSTASGVAGERDTSSIELSNNLRRRLTAAAVLMIADRPLFGVGPGAFKDEVDAYAPPLEDDALVDARPRLAAHNVVLELWAGSGTPAAIAYLFFLAGVVACLERHRRRGPPAMRLAASATSAALIGLFVTSAFHNYQYDNLLWTLCGLAISVELWSSPTSGRRGSGAAA